MVIALSRCLIKIGIVLISLSCSKEEIPGGIPNLPDDFTVLAEHVDSFVNTAKEFGYDLSYVYDRPVMLGFDDELGSAGVVGQSWGLGNDDVVRIKISKAYWDKATPLAKITLMYHELAHDILNLKHDPCKEGVFLMCNGRPYDKNIESAHDLRAQLLIALQYASEQNLLPQDR